MAKEGGNFLLWSLEIEVKNNFAVDVKLKAV
jgi:hypothetical protein